MEDINRKTIEVPEWQLQMLLNTVKTLDKKYKFHDRKTVEDRDAMLSYNMLSNIIKGKPAIDFSTYILKGQIPDI